MLRRKSKLNRKNLIAATLSQLIKDIDRDKQSISVDDHIKIIAHNFNSMLWTYDATVFFDGIKMFCFNSEGEWTSETFPLPSLIVSVINEWSMKNISRAAIIGKTRRLCDFKFAARDKKEYIEYKAREYYGN